MAIVKKTEKWVDITSSTGFHRCSFVEGGILVNRKLKLIKISIKIQNQSGINPAITFGGDEIGRPNLMSGAGIIGSNDTTHQPIHILVGSGVIYFETGSSTDILGLNGVFPIE